MARRQTSRKKLKKQAILWDLDNTLYHYDPCNEVALKATHEVLQRRTNITFDEFMQYHDAARKTVQKRLSPQAASHNRVIFFKWLVEGLQNIQPRYDLVLEMYRAYWETFIQNIRPHPDAHEVLDTLRGTHRMAVVTNQTTEFQLRKIAALGFEPWVDAVITSEEAGVDKPKPGIFKHALAAIEAEAEQAVMVGDHMKGDISGAQKLGIATIHTTEYSPKIVDGIDPDYSIDSLREVLAIL